jgi:hypothetical protein
MCSTDIVTFLLAFLDVCPEDRGAAVRSHILQLVVLESHKYRTVQSGKENQPRNTHTTQNQSWRQKGLKHVIIPVHVSRAVGLGGPFACLSCPLNVKRKKYDANMLYVGRASVFVGYMAHRIIVICADNIKFITY